MIQIFKKSILASLLLLFPTILSAGHDGGGHGGGGHEGGAGRSVQAPTPQWSSRNFRTNTNPNPTVNKERINERINVNNNASWHGGGHEQRNWYGHRDHDWNHRRNNYYYNNYYYNPNPYYYNAYPGYYDSAYYNAYYDPYYYNAYPANDYYYDYPSSNVGAGIQFQIGG